MAESLERRLPMSRDKVCEGKVGTTPILVEEVHKRGFIGKVIPAYVDHRQVECDGLDDGAISRFGHDDIDGRKNVLEGKGDAGE